MDLQLGRRLQLTSVYQRSSCAPRRHSLPCLGNTGRRCLSCSALANETSPSAPAGVRLLGQQYQGLVKPLKTKTASNNHPDSKRGSKVSTQQPVKSPKPTKKGSSHITSDSGSAEPRLNQSQRHSPLSSTSGRNQQKKQTSATTPVSSSGSSKKSSSGSRSSSSPARKPSIKQRPNARPDDVAVSPPPVLLGKGFGSVAVSNSNSSDNDSSRSRKSGKVLKLFRFGVTASVIEAAIQGNGWSDKVQQVDQLSDADVLVAVSCTPGGKHQNLSQGERAAANANIPFVVIGRRASTKQFYNALSPLLGVQTPEEKAAAAEAARKAAENKAFADQWFKAAAEVRWGGAVPGKQ